MSRRGGGGFSVPRARRDFREWYFQLHLVEAITDEERRGHLYMGLPALLVVSLTFGAMVHAWREADGRLNNYRRQARLAVDAGEVKTVELCYERTIDLGSDPEQAYFSIAKAEFARGDQNAAIERLNMLAPADALGYPPAHLWLGQLLLRGRKNVLVSRGCEVHLQRALSNKYKPEEAHAGLMKVFAARGEFETAETHMRAALKAKAIPRSEALLFYAQWVRSLPPHEDAARAKVLGRGAKEAAKLALEAHARLKTSPADDRARYQLVAARQYRHDYAGAVELLEAGSKLRPGAYEPALASAYYHWALALGSSNDRRALRTDLLIKSFQINPFDPYVVKELLSLGGDDAARVEKALAKQLEVPDRAPYLQAQIGAALMLMERPTEAFDYLEKAHKVFGLDSLPNANNLALAYALKKDADPFRGLALIDRVLAQQQSLLILDSRGRILIVMKRWREALNDLERALPVVADRAGTMQQMARAYIGLGDRQMASLYRKKARRILDLRAARRAKIDSGMFATPPPD